MKIARYSNSILSRYKDITVYRLIDILDDKVASEMISNYRVLSNFLSWLYDNKVLITDNMFLVNYKFPKNQSYDGYSYSNLYYLDKKMLDYRGFYLNTLAMSYDEIDNLPTEILNPFNLDANYEAEDVPDGIFINLSKLSKSKKYLTTDIYDDVDEEVTLNISIHGPKVNLSRVPIKFTKHKIK